MLESETRTPKITAHGDASMIALCRRLQQYEFDVHLCLTDSVHRLNVSRVTRLAYLGQGFEGSGFFSTVSSIVNPMHVHILTVCVGEIIGR